MFTRFLTVSAAIVLGSASVAGAQDITDIGTGDAEVVALSSTVPMVEPGTSEWIAINWTSLNAEARELKVTATGSEGVAVSYPTFPVDGYSSGYMDDTLSQSEVDYTALKITVAEDAPAPLFLRVTVSYVSDTGEHSETIDMPFDDGRFGNNGNGNDNGNGQGNGNGNSSGHDDDSSDDDSDGGFGNNGNGNDNGRGQGNGRGNSSGK